MRQKLLLVQVFAMTVALSGCVSGPKQGDVCAEIADAFCAKASQTCGATGLSTDCFQQKVAECCAGKCGDTSTADSGDINRCLTDIYRTDCKALNQSGYPAFCGKLAATKKRE